MDALLEILQEWNLKVLEATDGCGRVWAVAPATGPSVLGACDCPLVVIAVEPSQLVEVSQVLKHVLVDWGVKFDLRLRGYAANDELGSYPTIEARYDPQSSAALVFLYGVTSADLRRVDS